MSAFEIELQRVHTRTADGEIASQWIAEVENADAYAECVGKTPQAALHCLAEEFDEVLDRDPHPNWDDGGGDE